MVPNLSATGILLRRETPSKPTAVLVTYGNTLRTSKTRVRTVKTIHVHSKYKARRQSDGDYNIDYDVAVLLLDNPIVEDVVKIAPKSNEDIRAGRKLRLAGWGRESVSARP